MNWDIVAGHWKEFEPKVKEHWGALSDEQLQGIAGKRARLTGKIQEAYGVTQEQAELQLDSFERLNQG